MKDRIIMAGLLVGAAGGFAHGFAGLRHHHRGHDMARECVDAALQEVGAKASGDDVEAEGRRGHHRRRVREACADEARRQTRPRTAV